MPDNDQHEHEAAPSEIVHPTMGGSPPGHVFEVFQQAREGKTFEHGGSVIAPDIEMAMLYAREFYGRRQESHRIWVVPREAIVEINDPDLLDPPAVDRSYRTVGGYSVRDALRATRGAVAGAGSAQPD